ncbi:MAG: hypothetical protein ABIW83_08585, partial [Allosphingosinicella sp.]
MDRRKREPRGSRNGHSLDALDLAAERRNGDTGDCAMFAGAWGRRLLLIVRGGTMIADQFEARR